MNKSQLEQVLQESLKDLAPERKQLVYRSNRYNFWIVLLTSLFFGGFVYFMIVATSTALVQGKGSFQLIVFALLLGAAVLLVLPAYIFSKLLANIKPSATEIKDFESAAFAYIYQQLLKALGEVVQYRAGDIIPEKFIQQTHLTEHLRSNLRRFTGHHYCQLRLADGRLLELSDLNVEGWVESSSRGDEGYRKHLFQGLFLTLPQSGPTPTFKARLSVLPKNYPPDLGKTIASSLPTAAVQGYHSNILDADFPVFVASKKKRSTSLQLEEDFLLNTYGQASLTEQLSEDFRATVLYLDSVLKEKFTLDFWKNNAHLMLWCPPLNVFLSYRQLLTNERQKTIFINYFYYLVYCYRAIL